MSEPLNKKLVGRFIRRFHTRYEEESILSDVCNLKVFQEDLSKVIESIGVSDPSSIGFQGHREMKYSQLGKRAVVPVKAIESEVPDPLINSMCRNMRVGERNYILEELDTQAKNGQIKSVSFDRPTHAEFQNWCSKIRKPDHLFLPLDTEYHDLVFNWRKEHDYAFNIGEVAVSGPNIIHIHWVPLDSGIDAGYLVSSEGMTIVQKWFGDTDHPDEWFDYNSEYDKFSHNRPLMVYISNELENEDDNSKEKIELLYRVVLSQLFVDENHALKLNPTKNLSGNE